AVPESEWRGMAMFVNNQVRHDDAGMAIVYSHFQKNLKAIMELGIAHGASLVLSTVAVNLKDCAPFGSQHRPDLAGSERLQWDHLSAAGVQAEAAGNTKAALKQYEAAANLDDHYAEV